MLVVRLIENGGIDVHNAHYSVTDSAVLHSCYYAIVSPLCFENNAQCHLKKVL